MTGDLDSKKTVYSLEWAESVIKKLTEAHARATEIVLKKLNLTEHQLAILLACHRKEYYILRESIRKLDKSLQVLPWEYNSTTQEVLTKRMLSDILCKSRQEELESFIYYLTENKFGPMLEKPVNRGVDEG